MTIPKLSIHFGDTITSLRAGNLGIVLRKGAWRRRDEWCFALRSCDHGCLLADIAFATVEWLTDGHLASVLKEEDEENKWKTLVGNLKTKPLETFKDCLQQIQSWNTHC